MLFAASCFPAVCRTAQLTMLEHVPDLIGGMNRQQCRCCSHQAHVTSLSDKPSPVKSTANQLCASADNASHRLHCRRDCGAARNLCHWSPSAVPERGQVQCKPSSHRDLCDCCWFAGVLGNLPSHPPPHPPLEQQGPNFQSPEKDESPRSGETQSALSMVCHRLHKGHVSHTQH